MEGGDAGSGVGLVAALDQDQFHSRDRAQHLQGVPATRAIVLTLTANRLRGSGDFGSLRGGWRVRLTCMNRTVPVAFVLAVGVGFAVWANSSAAPESPRALSCTPRLGTAKIVGSPSCAAASCHGGDTSPGALGGEHTTVLSADPHRRAYSVLFQARSKRMVELLGHRTPAHQTATCLACHGATPPNACDPLAATSDLQSVGTCENCHGAAGNWLTTHYTPAWKAMSAAQKAEVGFVPTADFSARVGVCAGCHLGEPGREVDHRLIAAGHPALRFELSAYQSEPLYTKHWRGNRNYGPDAESWEWIIGQVGTARAAAKLLEHRAAEASIDGKRDWPELSEYTCFACHQDLTAGGPKAGDRKRIAPPGRLPWGSWSYPMPVDLAAGEPAWFAPKSRLESPAKLAKLFLDNDRPKPTDACRSAAAAVGDLDRWLCDLREASARSATNPLSPMEIRTALARTIAFGEAVPKSGPASTDWDRSTQAFLGTAALYRGLVGVDPASRSESVERTLREIAAGLNFPADRRGGRFDGPGPETAAAVAARQKRWQAIRTALVTGERP